MSSDSEIIEGEIMDDPPLPVPAPPSGTLFRTEDPAEILTRATEVATTLGRVIEERRLYATIGRSKHILVEGWTLLGSMLGVFPVCVWTQKTPDGWEARVEARTRDGATVGAAEAQCDRTESSWAKRDDYAIRSMAQTRATSKALRLPLGFVVVLAGYDATPAEEMPADASRSKEAERYAAKRRAKPRSQDQNAKLHALLGDLKKIEPAVDWKQEARNASRYLFGKESSTELTTTEMGSLIDEFERRKRQLEAEPGPV